MKKLAFPELFIISLLLSATGICFAIGRVQPTITTVQANISDGCVGVDHIVIIQASYDGSGTLDWDDITLYGTYSLPSNYTKGISSDKKTCTLTFSNLSAYTYGFTIRVFEVETDDDDAGSYKFTIYENPLVYNVSGGGPRCENESGLSIDLSGSETGVVYELYRNLSATGQTITGTGSPVSFTNIQEAGSYTIKGTRGGICTTDMSGSASITVNPLPTPSISGDNEVCAGDQEVYTTGLQSGHTYSWSVTGGSVVGSTMNNSVTINWGSSTPGSLQVTETITATGCQATSSAYSVTINPLPTPSVSGDNEVCAGDQEVYTTGLQSGHTYSWSVTGGSIVGLSTNNTVTVNWGSSTPGSLQVTETITATGCFATSPGLNITINPLPQIFNLNGSSSAPFTLSNSVTGVEYTLYRNSTSLVTMAGTGSLITFGNFTAAGDYNAKARNTTTFCESALSNTITISGPTVGIDGMFVLDVSGSMGGIADPGCTSNCMKKIEVLENSAIKTTNYWLAWNMTDPSDDKVGVTLFRTSAIPSNFSGQALIDVNTTNIQTVNNYIDLISASGSTSMGGGLLSAQGNLTNAMRPRNIILFTDGIQNTDPMVIKTPTGPGPDDYSLTINSTALNTDIKIFTIGITSPTNYYQLLEDIARKTQGSSYLSYYIEDDLTDELIHSLLMAMKDQCPQLVSNKKGKITGSQTTETMQIDNYKPRVAFLLNGYNTDESDLSMEVKKDDIDLTGYGSLTDLGNFKIFILQLPVIHEGILIHSGGEWDIQISGNENQEYGIYTIVDENQLDYTCNILPSERNAGDPIQLEADILFKGDPLYENITVEAYVAKPGEDLGTIMSTRSVRSLLSDRKYILRKDWKYLKRYSDIIFSQDAFDFADKKLHLMLESDRIRDLLNSVSSKVTLTHEGNGHFSGSFANTDVTGPYQVLFKISGQLPGMGPFQRIEMHCTVRGFGNPDPGNSGINHIPRFLCLPDRILIRPVNQFGNYIGPGYSHMIQATTNMGKATNIIDNLDGSYTLVFKDQRFDPSTTITATVGGKTLYRGKLSDISQKLPADARLLRWRAKAR